MAAEAALEGNSIVRRRSERALIFMAKWPEPGRAKTRLCPALDPHQAAELARCFLLDTLGEAAQAGVDRWLAFAPASSAERFRALAGPCVGLIPAETRHLGVALELAQAAAFDHGYRAVAVVASDLPHLPAERYAQAFEALGTADVALGPCGDGGYYLLAASRPTPHLFHGVAWSGETVYARTIQRAAEAGLRVASLAPSDDVDRPSDLPPLLASLARRPGAGHTLAMLRRLMPTLAEPAPA